MSSVSFSYLLPLPPPLITALRKASFFLFPNQEKYIHRMFSVGKKNTLSTAMSGLFHVPYPLFFLKGYLATLPVFYANLPCDITVYQGLLLLKLPAILV